jgi:hypothetical protein
VRKHTDGGLPYINLSHNERSIQHELSYREEDNSDEDNDKDNDEEEDTSLHDAPATRKKARYKFSV